ncbi:MAG: adenylyltransferase/cytidyltransferase family protein, partial [Spirochaetaceae bacterium]|nr:adenylyltransferase/cytidyltransferase family protein [Spirochaetaceae bacterium]
MLVFLYCGYGILIMKTVLVFGTFDVIHPGHQWFLRNAARHGDRLVAVVSRDT